MDTEFPGVKASTMKRALGLDADQLDRNLEEMMTWGIVEKVYDDDHPFYRLTKDGERITRLLVEGLEAETYEVLQRAVFLRNRAAEALQSPMGGSNTAREERLREAVDAFTQSMWRR